MTTDKSQSPAAKGYERLQSRIAIVVALCWIIYLSYLLLARTSPILGDWAGPPHLTSSLLLALTLAAALSPLVQNNALLGWWTIVSCTAFIVTLECLQLLTATRSFQFADIAEGVAGASMAAMIAAAICRIIGRPLFIWLAITVAVVVLVVSSFIWLTKHPVDEQQIADIHCNQPVTANLDWQFQLVRDFHTDGEWVSSNIGFLCVFNDESGANTPTGVAATANHNPGPAKIKFTGGGLVSAPLPSLREALSISGQLTFGVRLRADNLQAGRPPRQIVSLQSNDKRPLIVARIIQNGPHASASFGFAPWQRSGTTIANRIENKFHEIVLTYDGTTQTTYFDSVIVGIENTHLDTIEKTGSELLLNIGKRTDGRWNAFHGDVEAIIIGTKSVSAEKIGSLFQQTR